MFELNLTRLYVAMAVLIVIAIIVSWKTIKSALEPNYDGYDKCYMCNKESCAGCALWDPMTHEVKSAYLVQHRDGRVMSSSTLTFKEDIVVMQHPSALEGMWQIPNFLGCHKTTILKWYDRGTYVNKRTLVME